MNDKPKYNPQIHHRHSIRLKGYDYSQEGLYFITICTKDRECFFGEIKNDKMILNEGGKIADKCWLDIPKHFPNVILYEHTVMPNHVHGIIELTTDTNVGAKNFSPNNDSPNDNDVFQNVGANNHSPNDDAPNDDDVFQNVGANDFSPNDDAPNDDVFQNTGAKNFSPLHPTFKSPSKTVGSVIRGFKIGVTKWFRSNTNIEIVWQRNYYDHIIRNEQSYQTISVYIINNSANWKEDKFFK